jgi:Sulfotransferase domain
MLSQSEPSLQSPIRPKDIDAEQRKALRRYDSWQRFHRGVRSRGEPLLKRLDAYPDSVLVAGCQRSGTTMLTRVIARSPGFRSLQLTHDDELDAALALCGEIDLPPGARYCLQTTYLNENFREYTRLGSAHRLIWVLRNPYSVVHSMVYNWKRFALNELYEACGVELADSARLKRFSFPWPIGPSKVEKACLAYSGKSSQVLSIRELVDPGRLLVVDYDELARAPRDWLPLIFDFIGCAYSDRYAADVRTDSVSKADALRTGTRDLIKTRCEEIYARCSELKHAIPRA